MEMSNDKTSIAAQLDTQQKKAVFAETNGNYCVQAVAGSGKTRVLAYRIATLIGRGVEPQNILLLSLHLFPRNLLLQVLPLPLVLMQMQMAKYL